MMEGMLRGEPSLRPQASPLHYLDGEAGEEALLEGPDRRD